MNFRCILDDDLVLYALGELDGERKAHLEEHLPLCPECRRRVGQYRQLRGHLVLAASDGEVAVRRALLKQRILAEAELPPAPAIRPRKLILSWQPAIAIILALAAVVALASTSDVAGHFPFSQYIGFTPTEDQFDSNVHPGMIPDFATPAVRSLLEEADTGAPVPSGWEAPDELPLGLYRLDSYVTPNGSVAHYFLSREYGFEVSVSFEDQSMSRTQHSGRNAVVMTVHGIDVLVNRRESGHVSSLLWVDGDTLISIRIERAFGGYLAMPDEFLPIAGEIIQHRATHEDGGDRK